MYILGSVYSTGDIYVGNGEGNKIDGMFISGTEGSVDTAGDLSWQCDGYIHVNDDGTRDGITYYSTKPEYYGAIKDTNTSFECKTSTTDYSVPTIANKSDITEANAYGNEWANNLPLVISEDTYFDTLDIEGDAFDIDLSKGDVTVVIDTLKVGSGTPYIDLIGTEGNNNKAYIYINSYTGVSGDLSNLIIGVNLGDNKYDWRVFAAPGDDTTAQEYLDVLGDKDRLDFHISNGSKPVILDHAKIAGNVYIDNDVAEIASTTWIDGNVTTNASDVTITDGNTMVRGTVCAPDADMNVVNSATVYGQVHTNTLTINGAGRIIYKGDSMAAAPVTEDTPATTPTAAPNATATPAPAVTNAPTGDTTIDIEETVYVKISEIDGKTLTFNVAYTTPSDDKTYTLTTSDVGGTHTEDLKYVAVRTSEGSKEQWSGTSTLANAGAGTVTLEFPTWFSGYTSSGLTSGTVCLVTVTANDGSGATDSVKIVFVDDDYVEATPTPVPEVTPIPAQSVVADSGYAYIFGYEPEILSTDVYDEDGTYLRTDHTTDIYMAPQDNVTREQVAAMITRMLDQLKGSKPAYKLTDNIAQYDGTWFVRGLACLNSKGAFGEEVYTGPITRAEVAKLIVKGFDLEGSADVPYEDVAGNQYEEYISTMYYYGLMTGTTDETFEPNRIMTRAEFCKLFNNIIGRDNCSLTTEDGVTITPATYSIVDVEPGAWYYDTVLKATSAYDDNGNVDLQKREDNIRNKLDDYDSQLLY
jgi:hypothetical protein